MTALRDLWLQLLSAAAEAQDAGLRNLLAQAGHHMLRLESAIEGIKRFPKESEQFIALLEHNAEAASAELELPALPTMVQRAKLRPPEFQTLPLDQQWQIKT